MAKSNKGALARESGDSGRLVRQRLSVTLKGHTGFLLSYFQVWDVFLFTAVVVVIIIIPILC